jgi:hypothetical protein
VTGHSLWLLGAAFCLVASTAPTSVAETPLHHDLPDGECTVPAGGAEVAARRSKFIVFGEMHGTRESPEFLGALACGLASRGERLLIAVELNATANSAIQNAWLVHNEQFDEALRTSGWFGRKDGVGSTAMFELLQKLHRLRVQGKSIDVVAFNSFSDNEQRQRFKGLPGQGPHEAAQAENIRRASQSRRYDHILILVGNLHARKVPVENGAVSYQPMAMQLGSAAEVITLNMQSSGGSMWNCLTKPNVTLERGKPPPPDALDCGIHETGRSPFDLGPPAFIRLGELPGKPTDPNYDGFYWLGQVNGSPPAASAF